jgi:hypothetical protein
MDYNRTQLNLKIMNVLVQCHYSIKTLNIFVFQHWLSFVKESNMKSVVLTEDFEQIKDHLFFRTCEMTEAFLRHCYHLSDN